MAIETTFWETSAFWKWIDEDVKRYWTDLDNVSDQLELANEQIGSDQSTIRSGVNKDFKDNIDTSKVEVKRIADEYKTNVANRRTQAEQLVANQEAAASLEANVSAAAANQWWRLSVWQLASISKDITNQFAISINNALKDNINFQTSLDDKLSTFWFTVIDKNKILDEFKKVLVDEETQPLLDAVASVAKTKIEFIKKLWDVIAWFHKDKEEASSWARKRESRIENEVRAFNVMNADQRTTYLRDKMWVTWNVLTDLQKNSLIKKASEGWISLSEINDIIQNMSDKTEQTKLIQQQAAAWSEEVAEQAQLETWLQSFWPNTFNKGTAPVEEEKIEEEKIKKEVKQEASKANPEPTGYKIWNVTYTSKEDYNLIKKTSSKLKAIQKSDPAKFKRLVASIKEKYIIS